MNQLAFWDELPLPVENPNPSTAYVKAPRRVLTVKELPDSEQPVNRLHCYGPAALSTAELLAILLGHAHQLHDASALLAAFDGLAGVARAPATELQQQPGLGSTTAARIKAALELGRRLVVERPGDRPQIRTPADAANLIMAEMGLLEQEHLRVIAAQLPGDHPGPQPSVIGPLSFASGCGRDPPGRSSRQAFGHRSARPFDNWRTESVRVPQGTGTWIRIGEVCHVHHHPEPSPGSHRRLAG